MYGQDPFLEFESGRGISRGAGWVLFGVMLAVALVAVSGVGYGIGRGTWTLPTSITDKIPAPLARWLPPDAAGRGMPAQSKEYGFELVEPQAKRGPASVAVRLVHRATGKPVSGASIFAKRLDMAPEAMPTMTAALEPQPEAEPGVYRFATDLAMKGGWRLSLAAKVPGETGTVQDELVLKAVP